MKITKDNIEVLLFVYAEGNLSPQEQKEVEAFLESNPQYKQMLSMYLENESVEKPLDIVFEEKMQFAKYPLVYNGRCTHSIRKSFKNRLFVFEIK